MSKPSPKFEYYGHLEGMLYRTITYKKQNCLTEPLFKWYNFFLKRVDEYEFNSSLKNNKAKNPKHNFIKLSAKEFNQKLISFLTKLQIL